MVKILLEHSSADKMDQSQAIFEYLGRVKDPEIPVLSLHDMGILRGVGIASTDHPNSTEAMQSFRELHPDAPEENAEYIYKITISPTYVG